MSEQVSVKELAKLEWLRCSQDIPHFLRKWAKLQNPGTGGKIPFDLFDFQEEAIKMFETNQYNIVLKARQLGLSTTIAGLALHKMVFMEDANILIIAIDQKTSKNLLHKIKVMYRNLPKWMQVKIVSDNKHSFELANGCIVKAVAATDSAARSESLTMLIIDEAAFIDLADDIWTAASPALSASGGKAVILSTPNGVGNFFHEMWQKALSGENGFNPIILPWNVRPDRNQAWYENECRVLNNDRRRIAQELECNFNASGETFIDPEVINWYLKHRVKEPMLRRGFDGNLWVWEEANPAATYVVSADVARGDGSDYSACHVFDVDTMEQVAEYKGKIDTKDYGNFLVALATEYNDALLVIENANVGHATIQQVLERNYQNLYYTYKTDTYIDESKHIRKGYDLVDKDKMTAGFTTSVKTRPLIIEKLGEYMNMKEMVVHSQRTMSELQTFIWKNGKAQAMDRYNDDLTMSLAILCWVRDTAIRMRELGMKYTKASLGNISSTKHIYKPTDGLKKETGWEMDMGQRGTEDLSWLIR